MNTLEFEQKLIDLIEEYLEVDYKNIALQEISIDHRVNELPIISITLLGPRTRSKSWKEIIEGEN